MEIKIKASLNQYLNVFVCDGRKVKIKHIFGDTNANTQGKTLVSDIQVDYITVLK